jgi:uroporphyrinogen decarboxylase
MGAATVMNSRERMLAAFEHRPVDRIPTDIWATGEVWEKLRAYFGTRDIIEALHIDGMGGTLPKYVGPALPKCSEGEYEDCWGMRFRNVNYGTGVYGEQVYYPLAEAETIDDLNRYRWPSVEWWDYSQMAATAERARQKQVVQCGYMAIFYHHNLLRGLEQSLMDPMEKPEFTHELLNRLADYFLEHHRRMFEAAGGLIDVAQVTDDLGTQTGPMIGMETFREFYKPHMRRFINLCKEFGIKVMHHDDGAIRPFLPELIEMGIDILNPVQWRCPGMEIEGLKQDFGDKLCFHGGIDNQQTLPHGTEQEVREEVRRTIDVLAADGTGYVLAPCHNIQAVTPIENVLAMYDEAWKYGKL